MGKQKRGRVPAMERRWDPLTQRVGSTGDYAAMGMTPPDEVWANDLYSVFLRYVPSDYRGEPIPPREGALHLSFHRHDRGAVRDWRHFQAIKNEVAGPERVAVEVFPPESLLVDSANEYHLWVLPVGYDFPFLMDASLVMTQEQGQERYGVTKARQRPWQPGIPTGLGVGT